jgi:hypothetical protein
MSSRHWVRTWGLSRVVFTVIYDANVLYPSMLRDLLIRVAQAGLVRARWTEAILDETFGISSRTGRTWTRRSLTGPGS